MLKARGMRSVLLGLVVFASLAASRVARANECNLYQPERFGQIRVGCSLTIFALPEVDPAIPTITRGGQALAPTIAHDQLLLKVTFEHYASPDSCDLVPSYENRTFDRYVVAWPDLQPGDEIEVDNYPMVVPSAGDCGPVDPFFACADGVKFCDDQPAGGQDPQPDGVDPGGCAAGGGALAWLSIASVLVVITRRRARRG
jgi:hypothetical protein